MSEQEHKSFFMEELDQWSEAAIISPLLYAGAQSAEEGSSEADWQRASEQARKNIRAKVLESYRNGQAAGPRKFSRPGRRDYPPMTESVQTSRWPVRVH